ncbi:MAG: anti-sigma factor [Gordonia amarae]
MAVLIDNSVEITVPACQRQVPIVREVAHRALLLEDWMLDDIADVDMVIDEICARVMAVAEPAVRLTLALTAFEEGVAGQVMCRVGDDIDINTEDFGWQMVVSMTDGRAVDYVMDGSVRRVIVGFVKRRSCC